MRNRRNLILSTVGILALTLPVLFGLMTAARLRAQVPAALAQPPKVPQWQIDAGGKMTFEVASVKQNRADPPDSPPHANIALDPTETYAPAGGLFSVGNFSLPTYIAFAYKLTPYQLQVVSSKLPGWAKSDRFDIEARAPITNPTKDQMRLMLQSLLEDRFKIATHFEQRQTPVLAMTLAKAGRTGPQLVPHTDDPPCAPPGSPGQDGWPAPICGALLTGRPTAGLWRLAIRNVTMRLVADALPAISMKALDRPVVDETGLTGTFDLRIEFAPSVVPLLNGAPFPNFTPSQDGPAFQDALENQLGLKLASRTALIDVLVIDHVEEPSPN